WVHRPRTVVMECKFLRILSIKSLQWVHRPRTVVMLIGEGVVGHRRVASMGPPSENGGYAGEVHLWNSSATGFNGSTVRERWSCVLVGRDQVPRSCFNGSTVRERWLCHERRWSFMSVNTLQWVHRPRTVVMKEADGDYADLK